MRDLFARPRHPYTLGLLESIPQPRQESPPLGVNAVFGTESASGFLLTLTSDVLLLDAETPSTQPSGGGFGNTVQASDGTFVTSYSYRAGNGNTYAAVVRWKLP